MKSLKNRDIAIDRIKYARENNSHYLDLSSLNLSELPDKISDLHCLIELDLSYNFFSEMPTDIARLENLQILNLSNNYIYNIEFDDHVMYRLEILNISRNFLYDIPYSLNYLSCKKIFFNENPFLYDLPLSLEGYNVQYIQEYFNQIKYREKQRFYETKLIFVGRGEVGKTTLMKVIKDPTIEIQLGTEAVTHGITIDKMELEIFFPAQPPHYNSYHEIENVFEVFSKDEIEEYEIDFDERVDSKFYISFSETFSLLEDETKMEIMMKNSLDNSFEIKKDIRVNLWDFGGQEIYHSTHQFFLTKRSIYIFVWEPRKDTFEEDFDYWLNIVNLLGNGSPVLIVMNKSDLRFISIDEKRYKETFPNIVGFYQLSCLTKDGLDAFLSNLNNTVRRLDHIGEELPKSWIQIRRKLGEINKDYISISDFKNLCKEIIYDLSRTHLELISDYLHDIGEIIHFKNLPLLRNIIIINPQWATKAVYSLIDTIEIQKNYGVFSYSDLETYLNLEKYPVETHIQLLELMDRFEICFKTVGSSDKYVIPELLKNEIPNQNAIEDVLLKENIFKFRYKFNFLPDGILGRLICKLFYLLNSDNYWKNGAIFNYNLSSAVVMSDKLSKTINITIAGSDNRDLYGLIKNEISQIFQLFKMQEGKEYNEEFACNCSICINDQEPNFFPNIVLKKFIDTGRLTIDCFKSALTVNINGLLFKYRSTNAKKDIIYDIIAAISKLQGLSKIIDKHEDSRNSFISSELSSMGIISKDQSRYGLSETGKTTGEIDIKIELNNGNVLTFYEGMNLEYLNKTTINNHIAKLINNYDVLGLPDKFLVCYCTAKDFIKLVESYFLFIDGLTVRNTELTDVIDVTKNFAEHSEIKIYKSFYFKSQRKLSLIHILINIQ